MAYSETLELMEGVYFTSKQVVQALKEHGFKGELGIQAYCSFVEDACGYGMNHEGEEMQSAVELYNFLGY